MLPTKYHEILLLLSLFLYHVVMIKSPAGMKPDSQMLKDRKSCLLQEHIEIRFTLVEVAWTGEPPVPSEMPEM